MNNSQDSIPKKRLRPQMSPASNQSPKSPAKGSPAVQKEESAATPLSLKGSGDSTFKDNGKSVRRHLKKIASEPTAAKGISKQSSITNTTLTEPKSEQAKPQQAPPRRQTSSRASRMKATVAVEDQLYMTPKEQKLFQLAMKNSLLETENVNQNITQIEEMKTFHPTEEEFSDPLIYIEGLLKNHEAMQYGCVKIIPPPSFSPSLAFDRESSQKLPTRFQVLQDLSQGKAFQENNVGRTFSEFIDLAKVHEADLMKSGSDFAALEKNYWDMVENNTGQRTRVEYAADVATLKFGSGFFKQGQRGANENNCAGHPWNLNNLPSARNSLMQFPRRHDISGINIPWLYIGMRYSTFCWHYEDLMLYSINYSHWGQPKQWYCVPEYDREKFERAVKQKVSLLFKKDPNILLDIVTMVSPAYLQQQKVKVYKTLQKPGEFVLTLPGSYHAGFSTGLNIGEAVNFATKDWFEYGPKCQELYRKTREKIPVFPIEWLVVENIRHLEKVQIDATTRAILQTKYNHYANFELSQRTFMESEMRTRASVKAPGELAVNYSAVKLMENRDMVAEDSHQCHYCTDFAYLSLISCSKCDISYCIWHNVMCGCNVPAVQLVYRFSSEELRSYKVKIASAVSKDRQETKVRSLQQSPSKALANATQ